MPSSGGSGGGSFGGSGGGFHGGFSSHSFSSHNTFYGHGRGRVGRAGCLPVIIIVCLLLLVAIFIVEPDYFSDTGDFDFDRFNPYSYAEQYESRSEAMESDAVFTGKYIKDKTENVEYIADFDELENALAYFHKRTGIIPYLYMDDEYPDDMTGAAYDEYMKRFDDEGHLLMYFVLDENYYEFELMVGDEVRDYLGDDGVEYIRVMLDFMDNQLDYSEEFGTVLSDTLTLAADEICIPPDEQVEVTEAAGNKGESENENENDNENENLPASGGISVSSIAVIGIPCILILAVIVFIAAKKGKRRKNDFTDVEDYLRENGDSESNEIYDDFSDRFRSYDDSDNDWDE